MKKFYTLCLILALSLGAYAQTKKIAVYVMGEGDMNSITANKMSNALAQSGIFEVSDRTSSFRSALGREQSYQRSGSVDETEIARLGKQYGVQYVCVVAILDILKEKYFTARILNVETAQVISSANSSGNISTLDNLTMVVNTLSDRVIQSFNESNSTNTKKIAVYVIQAENKGFTYNVSIGDVSYPLHVTTKKKEKDVSLVIGDQLVAGFSKSKRYVAVERTNGFLNKLGEEQTFQRSGAVDDAQISRISLQFGVQYVCVVEVKILNSAYNIYARIIDIEKNVIVNSCEVDAKSLSNVSEIISLADKITNKLSGVILQEMLNVPIVDCQGHKYPIVKIGNQIWMAENLQCTQYDTESERAGQTLQTLSSGLYAPYYSDGRYVVSEYGLNITNEQREHLGLLYNWAAAMGYTESQAKNQTGSYSGRRQGICPNGWHLPNRDEWNILMKTLGGVEKTGAYNEGGFYLEYSKVESKLKSRSGWYKDDNGTDDYGFCVLPAGIAEGNEVLDVGLAGWFWTTEAYNYSNSYNLRLLINDVCGDYYVRKRYASSVRCVKN